MLPLVQAGLAVGEIDEAGNAARPMASNDRHLAEPLRRM